MNEPFGAAEFQRESGVGAAQMADLDRFRLLLAEWSGRMNLVGPSALETFWLRHAWDSAQLLRYAPQTTVWADIGAGAGFPGLVLATLLKDAPGAQVHLVESMGKRCRFLSDAVGRLCLPATVHNVRAEESRIGPVQIVTARACAPLPRLFQFAEPFFKAGATGLFLKGKDVELELAQARKSWRFRAELLPSLSADSGHILKVETLSRAG